MIDLYEFYFKHKGLMNLIAVICIFTLYGFFLFASKFNVDEAHELIIFAVSFCGSMGMVAFNEIYNNHVKYSEEFKKGKEFFRLLNTERDAGKNDLVLKRQKEYLDMKQQSKDVFKFHCFVRGFEFAERKAENYVEKVLTDDDKQINSLMKV